MRVRVMGLVAMSLLILTSLPPFIPFAAAESYVLLHPYGGTMRFSGFNGSSAVSDPGPRSPAYDDSGWKEGRGALSSETYSCPTAGAGGSNTIFPTEDFAWIRAWYHLDTDVVSVHVHVRVEGYGRVYVDGPELVKQSYGYCTGGQPDHPPIWGGPSTKAGDHIVAILISLNQAYYARSGRYFDLEVVANLGTPPAAPEGLAVSQPGLATLPTISWGDPLPSAGSPSPLTAFAVYRNILGQEPSRIATLPPTQRSYVDETTEATKSYDYWVTAENQVGEGPKAGPATSSPSATCLATVCYRIRYESKLGELEGVIDRGPADFDARLRIERGRLWMNASDGVFESIPLVSPSLPGILGPQALSRNLGAVATAYEAVETVCLPGGPCEFQLAEHRPDPEAGLVGDLWIARLERYEDGRQTSSLPFHHVRLSGSLD